jgi:phage shock protein A
MPKMSLAFNLETDEEVDNFFNVYRIYRKTPYYEELKKDIERLEEKKEKLTADVAALQEQVNELETKKSAPSV